MIRGPASLAPAGATRAAHAPRYELMDVARGFAVLGILWLNIFLFALPFEALVIPGIWGVHNLLNEMVWEFTSVGVAGVMRGMFSILFGASAMLLLSRAERADDQVMAIDRYFRRLIWLIVLGSVHAYLLIWPHDILYAYGVLGMLIFPFRHVSSRKLVVIAAIMIVGSSLFTGRNVEEIGKARAQAEEALPGDERERLREEDPLVDELGSLQGGTFQLAALTPEEQERADADLEALIERLSEEMDERQGGYVDNLVSQAPDSFQQQTTEMIGNHLLDIGAFLLIGMVLYRTGFFHGVWPARTCLRLAAGGYALGILIGVLTRMTFDDESWIAPLSEFVTEYGFDVRRLALALANFALLSLMVQRGLWPALRSRLAACGRMALTLYVSQTVVCNAIFLGYGLSLFGQAEHFQLTLLALALTLVQLFAAPLVLSRFGQGPLEWLLRVAIDWGRSDAERVPREPEAEVRAGIASMR